MIKDIIGTAFKIIDKIVPDRKQAADMKLKVMEMEQAGEFKAEEHRYDVILAEAKSSDKYTSRARPTSMYVFYALIVWLMFIIPVIAVFNPSAVDVMVKGMKDGFDAIPPGMWTLGVGSVLGYTGARSYDKKQILNGKK